MQSGITASTELHSAFTDFLSTSSLFALPITITSETLTPLPALPFKSNSSFESSLSQLEPHVEAKTPRYIILRRQRDTEGAANADALTIITYIPSGAPVRAKTLFASTRATVIRELGRERFAGKGSNLFCTDRREILDVQEWEGREGEVGGIEESVLTREEREEKGLRRAEEEERYNGTKGRDLMGIGNGGGGGGADEGEKTKGARMKMDDSARKALAHMGQRMGEEGEGEVVQLCIDLSTEILILSSPPSNITPANLQSKIPTDTPSFTFYHYPSSASIIFIYCCPGSLKIKERMLYACSRANVVVLARDEGVEVAKRIEIGAPEEIGEDRLMEELAPTNAAIVAAGPDDNASSARPGFARPKRPGKR